MVLTDSGGIQENALPQQPCARHEEHDRAPEGIEAGTLKLAEQDEEYL